MTKIEVRDCNKSMDAGAIAGLSVAIVIVFGSAAAVVSNMVRGKNRQPPNSGSNAGIVDERTVTQNPRNSLSSVANMNSIETSPTLPLYIARPENGLLPLPPPTLLPTRPPPSYHTYHSEWRSLTSVLIPGLDHCTLTISALPSPNYTPTFIAC
ncbi:hypothetical protein VNI00_009090 [Paramarasmius palmivorus]|uniref:Uncharacterized protein n=1 Tax=Paramarasmius palmivorus TaxID=297713 RepID=A0AAW0CTT6_9AGAR